MTPNITAIAAWTGPKTAADTIVSGTMRPGIPEAEAAAAITATTEGLRKSPPIVAIRSIFWELAANSGVNCGPCTLSPVSPAKPRQSR